MKKSRAFTAELLSEKICDLCFDITALERELKRGNQDATTVMRKIQEKKNLLAHLEEKRSAQYDSSPRSEGSPRSNGSPQNGNSPRLLDEL